jgi:arsenate reductase
MAEAYVRHLCGESFEAYSAGIEAEEVNPHAVRVMAEIGIDISSHRSKPVQDFIGRPFDYVVTVCDKAREMCPLLPGAGEVLHKDFDNPADALGSEEEMLAVFRRVRDEIREWVEHTLCCPERGR